MTRPIEIRTMVRTAFAALMTLAVTATVALGQGLEQMSIDRSGPHTVKILILIAIFVFILLAVRRVRLPEIVRSAAIWLAALMGLVALYAYRVPLESAGREMVSVLVPGMTVSSGYQVMVRRSRNNQFVLGGAINGTPTDFVFDTGASLVVLSAADAARAGYHPSTLSYRVPVMTAAGMTEVAPVRIDELSIGSISMNGVRAAVAKPGDLDTSLLGMTFLNRLDGYEVR
ncbi:MAG: TIGR02281 family clan AA aspartic protease, partial [Pseudomonadota bacterium]